MSNMMNRNSAQLPTSLPTHQPTDIPPYLRSVWQRGGGVISYLNNPASTYLQVSLTSVRVSWQGLLKNPQCADKIVVIPPTCLYNQWIFYGEHWKHKESLNIDFQVKHFKGSQMFNYRISEKMPVCTFWFLIPFFLFYFYFYQTQVLSLSLLVTNKLAHVVKTLSTPPPPPPSFSENYVTNFLWQIWLHICKDIWWPNSIGIQKCLL